MNEQLDVLESHTIVPNRDGFQTSFQYFRLGDEPAMTRIIESDMRGEEEDIEIVLWPHETVELMHAIAATFGYTIDDGKDYNPDYDDLDIDDAQEF